MQQPSSMLRDRKLEDTRVSYGLLQDMADAVRQPERAAQPAVLQAQQYAERKASAAGQQPQAPSQSGATQPAAFEAQMPSPQPGYGQSGVLGPPADMRSTVNTQGQQLGGDRGGLMPQAGPSQQPGPQQPRQQQQQPQQQQQQPQQQPLPPPQQQQQLGALPERCSYGAAGTAGAVASASGRAGTLPGPQNAVPQQHDHKPQQQQQQQQQHQQQQQQQQHHQHQHQHQQQPAQAMHSPDASARIVDVKDVAKRFWRNVTPDTFAYVHHLAVSAPAQKLPSNVTHSLLQRKLRSGCNGLDSVLQPMHTPDGLGLADLHIDGEGNLQPEQSNVWQFGLSIVKAVHVGPTGFHRTREPIRAVARLCLFDRAHHRFIGNAATLPAIELRNKEGTWLFDAATNAHLVRCCCVQRDACGGTHVVDAERVSLYIELNVAYRLAVEDAQVVPQNEGKARKLVDELTTCWAMVSLKRCAELGRELEISVPLYMGSLYDPALLKQLYDEERRAHPIRAMFTAAKAPMLTFRAGPAPVRPAPLVPYGYMPPTMITQPLMAYALAAHRMALAQRLARQASASAPLADAALAAFPGVVADPAVVRVFAAKWESKVAELAGPKDCLLSCSAASGLSLPSAPALVTAWRTTVLEVAPLLHCSSLPPRHIGNFTEYASHRAAVAAAFCFAIDAKTGAVLGPRHPVEPLSHAGAEFLHRPFDVAETRVCLGDEGGQGRWLRG